MSEYSNRRENPRIRTEAKCWIERESLTLLATVTTISYGGLFLRTGISMPRGLPVKLTVKLDNCTVAARGHVAWTSSKTDHNGTTGFGICFDEILKGAPGLENLICQNSELSL